MIYIKAAYKVKTMNLIHISHEDNKALIDKLFNEVLIIAKGALNCSKTQTKFDVIEYYDKRINIIRLNDDKIGNENIGNYNFLSSFINSNYNITN